MLIVGAARATLWNLVRDHHLIQLHLLIPHNYKLIMMTLEFKAAYIGCDLPTTLLRDVFQGRRFSNRVTEWCQAALRNTVKDSFFCSFLHMLVVAVTTQCWQKREPGSCDRRGRSTAQLGTLSAGGTPAPGGVSDSWDALPHAAALAQWCILCTLGLWGEQCLCPWESHLEHSAACPEHTDSPGGCRECSGAALHSTTWDCIRHYQ